NIRETDTVVQVVRCFEDENIVHVEGAVDPVRDIETIQMEAGVPHLSTVERRREKAQKNLKSGDKVARQELDVLDKIQPALEEGQSARTVALTSDEKTVARNFFLLTTKPTIYAANVEESALADLENNSMVSAVREVAAKEA